MTNGPFVGFSAAFGGDTVLLAGEATALAAEDAPDNAPVVDIDAIMAAIGTVEYGESEVIDILSYVTDVDAVDVLSITSINTVNYIDSTGVVNSNDTITFTPGTSGGYQDISFTVSDGTMGDDVNVNLSNVPVVDII